jgi:hypothetical protein
MTEKTKIHTSNPKKEIKSDKVFLQIKPFKDNEFGINHWNAVISNLISLKSTNITFLMS